MEQLPPELIDLICWRMRLKEISELCLLNKYFYGMINQNTYYKFCRNLSTGLQKENDEKIHIRNMFIHELMKNFTYFERFYWSHVFFDHRLFEEACEFGCLEVVKLLEKKHLNNIYDWSKDSFRAGFREACKGGHLEIAEYLSGKYFTYLGEYSLHRSFENACKKGNLEIMKLIYHKYPKICITCKYSYIFKIFKPDNYIFRTACKYGHLDIAVWLIKTFPEIDIRAHDDIAFKSAMENNHTNIVHWLKTICPSYT